MEYYGLQSEHIKWFKSYLNEREQMVSCHNTLSGKSYSVAEYFAPVWRNSAHGLAARGGNLAKIPPNQVIADFGRGSSVESESE